MIEKGQAINFHGTGEGFGGDDSIVLRGTATKGDVGSTGNPVWRVEIRYEPRLPDECGDLKLPLVVECSLPDIWNVLCEKTGTNIEFDF